MPLESEVGKRYGRLLVIAQAEPLPRVGRQWLCRCDCGTEALVPTSQLRAGQRTSCGCVSRVDLIGARFGRLTVREPAEARSRRRRCWLCDCDCGAQTTVPTDKLRSGHTQSCGCLMRERTAAVGASTRTHGHTTGHATAAGWSPTYHTWSAMKARCSNPRLKHYAYYGGRGIRVCDRWQEFAVFLADMGERPAGTSLERVDNDGDYEPGNCRWATPCEQAANRRRSPSRPDKQIFPQLHDPDWLAEIYTQQGLTMAEIAQMLDCSAGTVRDALRRFGIPRRRSGPRTRI